MHDQLRKISKKLDHLKWLLWANRGMIVFGYLVSVTFNVLHADSNFFSIIIAIVSPSLLLFSFEVGSRIPIPEKPGILRWIGIGVRITATVAIAGATAYVSYFHQHDSFLKWGHDETQAWLLPGAIDAFMIVGSVGVIEVTAQTRDLELKRDALENLRATRETPVEIKEKPLNGRERIAIAVKEMPWATAKEIATKAQVKENYAATVMSELRRAAAKNGNGHQAEPVAVN